ncbi:hypothetical protein DUI37_28430, partial [Bacillus anthracis]
GACRFRACRHDAARHHLGRVEVGLQHHRPVVVGHAAQFEQVQDLGVVGGQQGAELGDGLRAVLGMDGQRPVVGGEEGVAAAARRHGRQGLQLVVQQALDRSHGALAADGRVEHAGQGEDVGPGALGDAG